MDDERFIAPWRAVFAARLGRPSVPVETLLRMPVIRFPMGSRRISMFQAHSTDALP
ncbi:hypothetical protein [Streptomyces chryseus]|uniref:hypothetical protein n=1 Tax=Streptomyces chryseus TaxID=68186 RepID=UPI00142F1F0D|nr:hypothetical protein [Streptomyces chryseus]